MRERDVAINEATFKLQTKKASPSPRKHWEESFQLCRVAGEWVRPGLAGLHGCSAEAPRWPGAGQ